MSVRNQLATLSGVFLAAIVLLNYLSIVNRPGRVEDSDYRAVVQAREFVAEILPPAGNIVESYLVALESVATQDAREIEKLLERWHLLERDYAARHEYWIYTLADGDLRKEMLAAAYETAQKFFSLGDEELWPAVEKGETERARAFVYTDLKELYDRHRADVDAAVARSNAVIVEAENAAQAAVAQRKSTLIWWSAAIAFVGLGLGWLLTRGLVRSMRRANDVLARNPERDLILRVSATADDEFGRITQALRAALTNLGDTLSDVRRSACDVQRESHQLSGTASLISENASEQTTALANAKADFEELRSAVARISTDARSASQLAQRCGDPGRGTLDFGPRAQVWAQISAQFDAGAREPAAVIARLEAALSRIDHNAQAHAEQTDNLAGTAGALAVVAAELLQLVASYEHRLPSQGGAAPPTTALTPDFSPAWPVPKAAVPAPRGASADAQSATTLDSGLEQDAHSTDGVVEEH